MEYLKNKCVFLKPFSVLLSFVSLLTLSFLASLLISPQIANAASEYDDVIKVTDTLNLRLNGYGQSCTDVDASLTWSESLQSQPDIWSSFSQALDTGSWIVTQYDSEPPYVDYKNIYVYWSEDEQITLNFSNPYGNQRQLNASVPSGKKIYLAEIMLNYDNRWGKPNCSAVSKYDEPIDVGNTRDTIVSNCTTSTCGYVDYLYFGTNVFVNYPPGYDGELVPDSPPTPSVESDNIPFWYASSSVDWRTALHDQNFNTFDGIMWTCSEDGNSIIPGGDGFAPILYWQIWDDSIDPDSLLADGFQSATAPIFWQAPKVNQSKTYRIAGWYSCGGTVEFTDAANYQFTISEDGILSVEEQFEDCSVYSGVFPFGIGGGEFPDLVGAMGCYFDNFTLFIQNLLQAMFIPQPDFFDNYFTDFEDTFKGQLGFVYTAFEYIVSWINSIVSVAPDCTLSPEGTFFGANININLCYFEESVPTIWNYGVNFVRLLLAACLVFFSYRRLFTILTGLGKS